MALFRKCAILCVLGFAADLLQTAHIQAVAERRMFLSVTTIFAIYLVGFLGHKWFVEHSESKARWWFTVAGSIGAAAGTAIVIRLGG